MNIKEDKSIAFQSLERKIKKSVEAIIEAVKRFGEKSIALFWTDSKDSTMLLCKKYFMAKCALKSIMLILRNPLYLRILKKLRGS